MDAYELTGIKWNVSSFTLAVERCVLERGIIHAITGPNGSGKSSFLNVLSLIHPPREGRLSFQGSPIVYQRGASLLAARRRIAYLLQSPYLFRSSVRDNIGYGLKVRGWPNRRVEPKVDEILDRLHLTPLACRNALDLSGGEAQRVALARVLVLEAEVFLLDEPTANVDKENIHRIEELVLDLNRRSGSTVVLTTHSRDQAYRMSRHVLSMIDGRLLDVSYDNVLTGPLRIETDGLRTITVGSDVKIAAAQGMEGTATLFIDPKDIIVSVAPISSSALNAFRGPVQRVEVENELIHLIVDIGVPLSVTITQRSFHSMGLNIGQEVWVCFKASAVRVL